MIVCDRDLTSAVRRRRISGVWLGLALIASGCGTNAPCVVKGTVQVNNAPAGGVYVVLNNSQLDAAGTGRTDKDGTYRLTVENAGDYAVTCFMPKVTISGEDYIEGEDIFQGRFRDANKPVMKVSVKAGENELPLIELR